MYGIFLAFFREEIFFKMFATFLRLLRSPQNPAVLKEIK